MTTSLAAQLALLTGQDPAFRTRRLVTRSGRRVRGIFPSKRFNRGMHWESSLERELNYRLEASWLVADACTQPTTINIRHLDGKNFDYTPDTVIASHSGELCCVECKPAHRTLDAELEARLRSINAHLQILGVRFVTVTEAHLEHSVSAANSKSLFMGYRMRLDPDERHALSQKMSTAFPKDYGSLCEMAPNGQGIAALAHGLAFFDVRLPLNNATVLSQTLQENCDAAHFLFS